MLTEKEGGRWSTGLKAKGEDFYEKSGAQIYRPQLPPNLKFQNPETFSPKWKVGDF